LKVRILNLEFIKSTNLNAKSTSPENFKLTFWLKVLCTSPLSSKVWYWCVQYSQTSSIYIIYADVHGFTINKIPWKTDMMNGLSTVLFYFRKFIRVNASTESCVHYLLWHSDDVLLFSWSLVPLWPLLTALRLFM
jgi:hypothetical protein